jgi:excisionase family DNA binding protein
MQESISIGRAATMLGVSISTLRRWHSEGRLIPAFRSLGGHRRYSLDQVLALIQPERDLSPRITLAYARVSSHEQTLAQDVIELMTVFSARLYGSRSHKNRRALQ